MAEADSFFPALFAVGPGGTIEEIRSTNYVPGGVEGFLLDSDGRLDVGLIVAAQLVLRNVGDAQPGTLNMYLNGQSTVIQANGQIQIQPGPLGVVISEAEGSDLALTLAGDLDMGGGRLRNLGAPTWDAASTGTGFLNGWTNYGSGFRTVDFSKDALGFVHLRGLMTAGTLGAACFRLPTGYRPAQHELFGTFGGPSPAGAACRIDVQSDGFVVVRGPSNEFVSLSGITFQAG